jgi:hypothetical protein
MSNMWKKIYVVKKFKSFWNFFHWIFYLLYTFELGFINLNFCYIKKLPTLTELLGSVLTSVSCKPAYSMSNRYLLRFFDCLAHPNLSATFATDQKWPICHLRISYQSLAGSLLSLKKSEFLKLIISFFHFFGCQNQDQWHKMSGKNTHIHIFYF